ncbi:hypothetical protein ACWIID_40750 [Streptomyces phaeochromogenes]
MTTTTRYDCVFRAQLRVDSEEAGQMRTDCFAVWDRSWAYAAVVFARHPARA